MKTGTKAPGLKEQKTEMPGGREPCPGDEPHAAAAPLAAPPRPQRCRAFVRRQLADALPAICQRLTDEAKEGGMPALRQLWQMAGIEEETAARAQHGGTRGARTARRTMPEFHPE